MWAQKGRTLVVDVACMLKKQEQAVETAVGFSVQGLV